MTTTPDAAHWRAANRTNWHGRVPIHVAAPLCDLPDFVAGRDTLRDFELAEVGDVGGKTRPFDVVHTGFGALCRLPDRARRAAGGRGRRPHSSRQEAFSAWPSSIPSPTSWGSTGLPSRPHRTSGPARPPRVRPATTRPTSARAGLGRARCGGSHRKPTAPLGPLDAGRLYSVAAPRLRPSPWAGHRELPGAPREEARP